MLAWSFSGFGPLRTSVTTEIFQSTKFLASSKCRTSAVILSRFDPLGRSFVSSRFLAQGVSHDFVKRHPSRNDRRSCGRRRRGHSNFVGHVHQWGACSIRAKNFCFGFPCLLRRLVLASRFRQARETKA